MADEQTLRTSQLAGFWRAWRGSRTAFGMLAILVTHGLLTPGAQADGEFRWARVLVGPGTHTAYVKSMAVDASGNVYTSGSFYGIVDFDPGPDSFYLRSPDRAGTFLSKLDANGDFVWARVVSKSGSMRAESITVDAAENVYITGIFAKTVNFGPYQFTSATGFNIFVFKLDANGDVVWARAIEGTGQDMANGIAVDTIGNVYITGRFVGTTDFDPGPGTFKLSPEGRESTFVSKLNTNGDFVWARAMGGKGYSFGHDIAVDTAGNVYTTGYFQGATDFDPGPGTFNLSSVGMHSIFLSKLDTDGNFVWARAMGGWGADEGRDIALDAAGNVYVTGSFQGAADLDPGPGSFTVTSTKSYGSFVSKLDADGNFLWARSVVGNQSRNSYHTAVDAVGNVYSAGNFFGTVDFDPGPGTFNLTSAGIQDIFVSKLDTDGQFIWARAMGGTSSDMSRGIGVDAAGNVYTTGSFTDTADFDPGPGSFKLTPTSREDVFVAKLSGSGHIPPSAVTSTQIAVHQSNVTSLNDASDLVVNHNVIASTDNTEAPEILTIVPSTTGPTNADSLDFTVAFDKAIVNFDDPSDLDISHNGTAHTGAAITGGPEVYTVTVEGLSGDGSFTLAVSTTSDVEDLAGHPLDLSVTSVPVLIDNTAPVFSGLDVSPSEASVGQEAVLTFASSEDLAAPPDVLVNGNPASASFKSPFAFAYTVSPLDPLGPAAIQINGIDFAGNAGQLNDNLSLVIVEAPGLPAAWPMLAALALLSAGAFALHCRRRRATTMQA